MINFLMFAVYLSAAPCQSPPPLPKAEMPKIVAIIWREEEMEKPVFKPLGRPIPPFETASTDCKTDVLANAKVSAQRYNRRGKRNH